MLEGGKRRRQASDQQQHEEHEFGDYDDAPEQCRWRYVRSSLE